MKKIDIVCSGTKIFIGSNLNDAILAYCKNKKIVVIADVSLKKLALQIDRDPILIPGFKTQANLIKLLDELFKRQVSRDTVLIALGGGTITDLAGFAASIYMRGLDLILVPTSIVGMVDAAIGGKTAIDTPFGKNLIGSIYHPKAVFVDLSYLCTLPEDEWSNGLAEIWKIGFVFDCSILSLDRNDPELIIRAIMAKIAVIEQDPQDVSIRRILNFGHTIGHAIEAMTDYSIPHGKAVAIGCIYEAHLSMSLGYLSILEFKKVEAVFRPFATLKIWDKPKFLNALMRDKKSKRGIPRFVLMDRIGHAITFDGEYCKEVMIEELEPTLKEMDGI